MQDSDFSSSRCVVYLEGYKSDPDQAVTNVSIETYVSLFCLSCCDNYDLPLCFVDFRSRSNHFEVPVSGLAKFSSISWTRESEIPELYCKVPLIISGCSFYVSGLCSVLRWTIKMLEKSLTSENFVQSLLGFRGGCLSACSENSVWTKFCEVELPSAAKETSNIKKKGCANIHTCLLKLEAHLCNPVKTHNIGKRKYDVMKKRKALIQSSVKVSEDNCNQSSYDGDRLAEDAKKLRIIDDGSDELEHSFLEGIDLTLADIITLPCIYFLIKDSPSCAQQAFPKTMKWYESMLSIPLVREVTAGLSWDICFPMRSQELHCGCDKSPETDGIEMKKSDVNLFCRTLPDSKVKCRNFDPSDLIQYLKENDITPHIKQLHFNSLDWSRIPSTLHPSGGELPKDRVKRKGQQLQSVVSAVLSIAEPDQVIVDFCSGGGHVGLLLAYLLPSCQVLLVENKEESIVRAKKRADHMALKNVIFFQSNLDYFKACFNVGVSLHACGVATDLVIKKCMDQGAAFVCCPCCYGAVQQTDDVKYPLSKKFQALELPYQSYNLLARCADRTELNTSKELQGIYCMGLIDTDRKFYAAEQGYDVILTTLQPPSCSTKHNLLIGQKL